MLDQNTDRMWYVIGAVLIGGIIIAAAVVLFETTVFESITDSLEGLMGKATKASDSVKSAPKDTIHLLGSMPWF